MKFEDCNGEQDSEKQSSGRGSVTSGGQFAPVRSDHGIVFGDGRRVEIRRDEEQFVGGGIYLFASVLERFLGLYSALNSFTQLVVRTEQRKQPLREWPPRAGDGILV